MMERYVFVGVNVYLSAWDMDENHIYFHVRMSVALSYLSLICMVKLLAIAISSQAKCRTFSQLL